MTSHPTGHGLPEASVTLAQRVSFLAQQAGLQEVYIFRTAEGQRKANPQLLLRYPADGDAHLPTGAALLQAVRLVTQMMQPMISVLPKSRNEPARALMIAPIITLEGMIWGALVGVSPEASPSATTCQSIIQTAEQIGGQISSWGRTHISGGPVLVNSSLHVALASPAALLHELRTPLAAARFALDIVEQSQGEWGDVDHEMQRAMRTLRLAILEAAHVVQWWSEAQQRGQFHSSVAPVSIEAALRKALALLPELAPRARITIAEDTPLALADPLALNRVFVNLIDNAFRHGQPGSVLEISATAAGSMAQVRFLSEGVIDEAALRAMQRTSDVPEAAHVSNVPDGLVGPGMSDAPQEEQIHGYGLGIVKTLMDGMGGQVSVESDWSRWTAFTVVLPAASQQST